MKDWRRFDSALVAECRTMMLTAGQDVRRRWGKSGSEVGQDVMDECE